ncbi:MAG: hypothetical protein ACM359_12190 [Bacillota bacterium]
MARYRKVATSIYADQKFCQLSKPQPNGQSLWLYLLTGQHTTAIPGLSCVGEMALAEALEWDPKGFAKAFAELSEKGMAKADWKARVLWLPNAIRYNEPENPNVVLGWRSVAKEIPECPLKHEAMISIRRFLAEKRQSLAEAFDRAFPEPFAEPFAEPLAKSLAKQEQEQEQEYIPADAGTASETHPDEPQKTVPTKASKPRKEPTGDHAELIRHFVGGWKAKYGTEYVMAAKDGVAASNLLKAAGGTLTRAVAIVDRFLGCDDPFIVKQRHPLPLLVNQINRFTVAESHESRSGSVTRLLINGEV